jgi:hypothetical protein
MMNIKINFTEAVCEGMDLIKLVQDKVQWQHFRRAGDKHLGFLKSGYFLTSSATINFSGKPLHYEPC